ncbi:SNARE associated Golgi protein [Mariprofundus micogutta]|uniref:SNARE associated Golgi protein n=1 Tax=Mariprofundus micogutta TaxID=1921010 RepID=A0A1L8CPR9_9PROT|nr:YqaA family protein [Mariprofundus micogutta]GAV20920.1 SNARE associated Golgi protein [Mariprofundus micogutta]
MRRLYNWTLAQADHPHAQRVLFLIAVIEASVFPIPPDVLLLLMSMSSPGSAFRLAAITTAGSAIGAAIGYAIGMFLFVTVAQPIIEFYHATETFDNVQQLFIEHGIWVVAVAGFSPIPFKIITIASGAFGMPFIPFILAALASRAARFYLEASLMYWGGEKLRRWVEKHFELLTVLVTVAVIGGFALLWV